MRVTFLFTGIFLLVAGRVAAQQTAAQKDTIIKSNTIEIIQSYKPQVKQAPKPELSPGLPPADTTRPVFSYDVPQQALYYTYNSIPLRPLALGKDSLNSPFANYIKLGGGNLSTIFLDAGIGSLHGANYESAIHVHHISQQGNIKYQQSALSGLEADGILHTNGNAWHASFNAERNQYNYYGYDHALTENTDSIKQIFTTIRLGVDMQNEDYGFRNLNYHPSVTASIYNDHYGASETTIGFNVPVSYSIDTSLLLNVGLNGTFTGLATKSLTQSNNILQLAPGLVYHNKSFFGHAYFNPTLGQNNAYLLPDLAIGYKDNKCLFDVSAGWQSLLHRNTFEELSTQNPYIFDTFKVQQTKTDEVYANADANIGSHFTITGRISWWQYSNLPTFLNNTGDQKQFHIIYDDNLNATSFLIAVKYHVANTFVVGGSGTFYNYFNGTQSHVWQIPSVKIKGDVLFHPLPQLTVTGYLTMLDGMYALNTLQQTVKLNAVFDLGGNIEYNIIPRLAVFLQVNNILNNKYQRWLGYEAYGINIYGGIRLKF